MLNGKMITLRPVSENDLDRLYKFHTDIQNRGDYFPRGILSQTAFKNQFAENGFWGREEGMLLIVNASNEILGHIEFFKTVNYLDEYELSYQIYDVQQRGKGIMTEVLNLMVRYLFETRRINRIRLVIHPDNAASRRLAEKCGFRHEGTARGAWYNQGRYQDVEIYAILHMDVIPLLSS